MIGIQRALLLAKREGSSKVEVSVEELERLLAQNKDMDVRLAKCMSRLSKTDYQAIFGDIFTDENTPDPSR